MITIKTFEFNHFAEKCYILSDETKEAVIIDCGALFPQEYEAITDYVAENSLTLKHLLCTHLHVDHVFGNPFIYNTYGLKPEVHRLETEVLPSPAVQAQAFGIEMKMEEAPYGNFISDNDKITFGNSELKALHIPGHSPGSIVYYCEKEGFAMTGDTLFCNSIGRTDLWGGSHETLIRAINDKLLTLPTNTIIYPGHGDKSKIGYERRYNSFL